MSFFVYRCYSFIVILENLDYERNTQNIFLNRKKGFYYLETCNERFIGI